MPTVIQGIYNKGTIFWDQTPPASSKPVRVIATFLEPDETGQSLPSEPFKDAFPNRWIDLDGKVEVGYDGMGYTNSLVMCNDQKTIVEYGNDLDQRIAMIDKSNADKIDDMFN